MINNYHLTNSFLVASILLNDMIRNTIVHDFSNMDPDNLLSSFGENHMMTPLQCLWIGFRI